MTQSLWRKISDVKQTFNIKKQHHMLFRKYLLKRFNGWKDEKVLNFFNIYCSTLNCVHF